MEINVTLKPGRPSPHRLFPKQAIADEAVSKQCHSQTGEANPTPAVSKSMSLSNLHFCGIDDWKSKSTHVMTVCSELSPDRTAHCGEPAARSARHLPARHPPAGGPGTHPPLGGGGGGGVGAPPLARVGATARHPERTCSARSPAGASLGRLRSVARAAAHCGEPAAAGGYECASRDTSATSDTQEYLDRLEINCRLEQFLEQNLTSLASLQKQFLK